MPICIQFLYVSPSQYKALTASQGPLTALSWTRQTSHSACASTNANVSWMTAVNPPAHCATVGAIYHARFRLRLPIGLPL
jgi:hypothetical protein